MTERGEIYSKKSAEQIRDFSGMLFERNITPTDIDGFIDFGGKVFVFFELKREYAPFPYGQRLSFENFCNALQNNGYEAVFILARHNTPHEMPIKAGETIVEQRYYKGVWSKPKEKTTLLETVNAFKALIKKEMNK